MTIEEKSHAKPSGFNALVWALFFFVIFAVIIFAWAKRSGGSHEVEDKRAAARVAKRMELQKADDERLSTVGWVDQAKGVVHIPVADAKRLVLTELGSKKPVPSQVKVEPWLPKPAPYDPDASEPPPSALPSAPQGADMLHFGDPAAAASAPAAPANAPAPIDTQK